MEQDRLSTEDVSGHDGDVRDDEGRTDAVLADFFPDDEVAYGTAPTGTESSAPADQPAPLLSDSEADVFLDRWREVQARFIDDPRAAVQDGDGLV
ncbi:MAG: hypothetical protein M3486_01095, partial [Actinomycetota bacterium]|nr:hypothetical protein [Actinomycetota bacterium]